ELANRVAVLAHGVLDLLRGRSRKVEVERRLAALDIAVLDDQVVAVDLDRRRREFLELFEQLRREARERQREVRELDRVRHQPDGTSMSTRKYARESEKRISIDCCSSKIVSSIRRPASSCNTGTTNGISSFPFTIFPMT